jgi:precorrin-4/cobalt-precorrin-4 C11-methyltransferase
MAAASPAGRERPRVSAGRVRFVGCGPGAADLLTLRAVRAIAAADVVVWSPSIVDDAVIAEHARAGATLLAWPPATQREVLAVYDRAVAEGLEVVVLKGGDPAHFGQLEDDLQAIRARELDHEIVPGVTTAAAAAAALRCELAAPGASLLLLAAGECRPSASMIGLLGAGRDPQAVAAQLTALGMGPATPCAVLVGISRPEEIVVTCALADLEETIADYGFGGLTTVLAGPAISGARPRL